MLKYVPRFMLDTIQQRIQMHKKKEFYYAYTISKIFNQSVLSKNMSGRAVSFNISDDPCSFEIVIAYLIHHHFC